MGFIEGILAATFAPLILVVGFVLWDKIWTSSAILLNITKSSVAGTLFFLVAIFQTLTFQFPFFETTALNVLMLLLSAVIGIIIGDNTWLRALALIGTKRVVFVDALKPFLAAVLGHIFLDENLTIIQVFGMFLTVGGVLIVSLEKTETKSGGNAGSKDTSVEVTNRENISTEIEEIVLESVDEDKGGQDLSLKKGYGLAVTNIFLDVIGAIFIKLYSYNLSSFEINFIRFGFSGYSMGLCGLLVRKCLPTCDETLIELFRFPSLTNRDWALIFFGILCVTFMCPFLTVYAYLYVELPICMTLSSLGPVYSVFIVRVCKGEMITKRTVSGCTLSISGVILLYWDMLF